MRNFLDQPVLPASAPTIAWLPCTECIRNLAVLSGMSGGADCPLSPTLERDLASVPLGRRSETRAVCPGFEPAFWLEDEPLTRRLS